MIMKDLISAEERVNDVQKRSYSKLIIGIFLGVSYIALYLFGENYV